MAEKKDADKTAFERARDQADQGNILREFWAFLGHNKKWWLLPIIVVLLLFGVLVIVGGTGAGPFIYSLF